MKTYKGYSKIPYCNTYVCMYVCVCVCVHVHVCASSSVDAFLPLNEYGIQGRDSCQVDCKRQPWVCPYLGMCVGSLECVIPVARRGFLYNNYSGSVDSTVSPPFFLLPPISL